jgi:hypothetical protein
MTVQEIMERTGVRETGLVLAWVKDAIHLMQSNSQDKLKVNKQNIIDGERDYLIPNDYISIKSISVKDTSDSKYKRIRRLALDMVVTEDTDPE